MAASSHAALFKSLAKTLSQSVTEEPTLYAVYDVLRDEDGNFVPDQLGKKVAVQGILTSPVIFNEGKTLSVAHFQDDTGGLVLVADGKLLANVALGDLVHVIGKVSQTRGQEELQVEKIHMISSGAAPKPRDVWTTDLLGERFSGQLVRVEGELTVTNINGEPLFQLRDEHGVIPVLVPKSFLTWNNGQANKELWQGGRAAITGIAGQDKAAPPFNAGYAVIPRTPGDIYFPPPPPPPPKPPSKTPIYVSVAVAAIAALLALYFFDRRRTAEKRTREVSKLLHAIQRSEAEVKKQAAFARFNPNPVLEFFADGALTYANDAARAMADRLDCETIEKVLPANVTEIVRGCIASQRPQIGCEVSVGARTIRWSFFPIHEITSVHAYGYDVTEQISMEAQLRQSQKLECIGQLAAGVAHDFNNLLAVIQGYATLALMRSDLPPKIVEPLGEINTAAERASSLTRQLLTFSRHQTIEARTLNLNHIVADLTKMLGRLIGASVHLDYHKLSEPAWIHADGGMMEQIIVNLAVNARDAMPDGGRLEITVGSRTFDGEQPVENVEARAGEFVCLTVKDTGIGMDDYTVKRIFEPFFTTKEPGKGTGLGLATVHGIVKQHKGWIEVTSRVGKGTSFTIYFPAAEAPVMPAESNVIRLTIAGGTETILLVEDDSAVRKFAREVLEEYGYEVIDTGSGNEAIAAWNQNRERIRLLLTDIVLPDGISGWHLADRLRGENPELKVIYSTGFDLQSVNRRFASVPNALLLRKPFPVQHLVRSIRDCLDSVPPVQMLGTAQIS